MASPNLTEPGAWKALTVWLNGICLRWMDFSALHGSLKPPGLLHVAGQVASNTLILHRVAESQSALLEVSLPLKVSREGGTQSLDMGPGKRVSSHLA